jgi:hypothetical protein
MRAFIGPVVLFVVGLLAWLVLAPRVADGTLAMLLMWGGIIVAIAALAWAAYIATRTRGRRSRL